MISKLDNKCYLCDNEVESCEDVYCTSCYKEMAKYYEDNLKKLSKPTGRNLFTLIDENE
jgi:predicted amidophosphoribosyltransferase